MAEQDIAMVVASTASEMSHLHDADVGFLVRRPRLILRTVGMACLDAAVTAASAVACFGLFHPLGEVTSAQAVLTILWLVLCTIMSFAERGLYATSELVAPRPNWRKLALAWLQAVAVGALLTFCVAAFANGRSELPRDMVGILRGPWLPSLLVIGYAAIALTRLLCATSASGPLVNRTVIIGEPNSMHDLMLRIRTGTQRRFDIVGLFAHDEEFPELNQVLATRSSFLGVPLFGGLELLETMIRRDAVDTVLVALPWSAEDQARVIIQRLSMAPVDVYIYPGMTNFGRPIRPTAAVLQLPLLMACARPIGGWRAVIKRGEDIVLSSTLLIFISPVMLTIATLIKITSKGPVFFRQRRLGYNNRVIEVLKFRSMFTHLADADALKQTTRGDKRVTPLGTWLRKFSLDELPQLLNVLRGDMSLVGPRPHALATTAGGMALDEAVPSYSSRHRVKPGITGWAQVNGHRGVLDSVDKIVDRVNHDLYYIENWSLALDLKILWLTLALVFADENAF